MGRDGVAYSRRGLHKRLARPERHPDLRGEIVTTYVAKPTVVVNAPAGTVTTTNLPTVSWVPTLDVDGGPQQAFAVYIYRRSYYSAIDFVPGASYPPTAAFELASAGTSWTPTTALPDDTYRAYVRVAQYVNGSVLWSDWAYSQFTVSVSRPQAPLTAASAESDFARNRLTVSDGQGIVDDFDTNTLSQYTVTNEVTISGGALVFGTAGVTGGGDAIHNGVALTDVVTVADVSLGSIGRSAASVYMRATSSSRALSANVTVNTLLGRGGILSVLAGSSTLASVTLRTTPSAATRYWLRATAIGDVVTAEWWTTDPALGGSPTDTCSTTLSGANKTTYGAGVVGKAGVSAGVSDSSRTLSYVGRFSAQPAVPADLFEIQASYDGRATWSAVRTTAGEGGFVTPAAGRAAAWDFEAPNGGEVNYRVRALHSYSGVYAVSDWVEASATWSSSQEWLVHPLDPSKSMRIRIVESSERQREARQGIHRPLGRATPIVVSDATGAEIGTLTIDVDIADHPLLDALIDARVPLLVLGAAGSAWPFPRYVVLGSPGRVEGGAKGFSTWTLNTLPWTQVDRPLGRTLDRPGLARLGRHLRSEGGPAWATTSRSETLLARP